MFRTIVLSACLAGLCAGTVLTVAQQPTVAPIILAAERYEAGKPIAAAPGDLHDAHSHEHAATHVHDGAWAPENGLERTFWTLVTNVGAGIGFALMLCAVYTLLPRITLMGGVMWGMAGYVVFFANPGIGLHPQLPGTLVAQLFDRQLWWLFTAVCSAVAVALVVWRRVSWLWGVAAALLFLPHLVGAPQPQVRGGLTPEELTRQFIWASIFANAVFWLTLGVLSALMFRRFAPTSPGTS